MFEDGFSYITLLQLIGTGFGVTQVLLSRVNNVNNYLFGIAGILISVWVRYTAKLYGDILLDLYYLVMSIYGWFFWKFGKNHHESPISYSSLNDHLKAIGIVIGCFALMAYWLYFHTDTDVPFWDAGVSAFAWAGMWLMARRKIENWIYLNISNIVAIPLLFHKDLNVYAGLTIFLFIMGVSGYLKWRKIIQYEKRKNHVATPRAVSQ